MLIVVRHDERDLCHVAARSPIVTTDSDEAIVELCDESQPVLIVDLGETLHFLSGQVRVEREKPQVTGAVGQVVVKVHQPRTIVGPDRTQSELEPPVARSDVTLEARGVPAIGGG